ncbi:MAG: hypothetical protein AB1384_15630 [Actinomycetota bacterium]
MAASAIIIAVTGNMWDIAPLFFLIPLLVLIPLLDRGTATLRQSCDCGSPDYIFMGMLGRSYCFRCFRCASCGRLLRLRD